MTARPILLGICLFIWLTDSDNAWGRKAGKEIRPRDSGKAKKQTIRPPPVVPQKPQAEVVPASQSVASSAPTSEVFKITVHTELGLQLTGGDAGLRMGYWFGYRPNPQQNIWLGPVVGLSVYATGSLAQLGLGGWVDFASDPELQYGLSVCVAMAVGSDFDKVPSLGGLLLAGPFLEQTLNELVSIRFQTQFGFTRGLPTYVLGGHVVFAFV